jgi:hypothetical protein
VEGFHFILQDEVLQDNRIPPRGFVPRPDTKPVGRNYPTVSSGDSGGATLAHWDDAPYELVIPKAVSGTVVIRATLWYQTTSREYVESLRRDNVTDNYGNKMLEIWERYDRALPFGMATATGSIAIEPAPPEPEPVVEPGAEPVPDGGTAADSGGAREAGTSPDAAPDSGGGVDAPTGGGDVNGGGCSCSLAVSQGSSYQAGFAFSLGLIGLFRHSRARSRRRRFE